MNRRTIAQTRLGLPSLFVGILAGCAMARVEDPEHVGRSEESLAVVAQDGFESYAPGPLGAPWSVSTNAGGASTIVVVATPDHGKVAELRGSTAADFLTASLGFSSPDPVVHLKLALKPAAGASFLFELDGAGSSLGARRIRLQRAPNSTTLVAQTAGVGSLDCGTLPSDVWSIVTLDVASSAHTFDVTINGAATACTGSATQIAAPFNGVTLMDASNDGWGGNVLFDDITVSSDANPPCTPPATPPATVLTDNFDAVALGALGAPYAITQSSARASTVRVVTATGHGRALQLHGSTASGQFVIADRAFSSSQTDIEFDFAIRPNSGAAFVVALEGAGASLSARRIRLQRAPNSSTLVASTDAGNLNCGTLTSNAWSSVALSVHTQSAQHTFDVRINGQATACTGSATGLGTPFNGINVMDASNAGYGGDVLFDDFVVTATGAPSGSCP
jgi:hypothetical protein